MAKKLIYVVIVISMVPFIWMFLVKASKALTAHELRRSYERASPEARQYRRETGFLFPDEVNPETHTKIGEHRYLQRINISEKKYREIRVLVDERSSHLKSIIDQHRKDRERMSLLNNQEVDFYYMGDDSLLIEDPLHAYNHFVESGKTNTGVYPVKYTEDTDYYIFSGIKVIGDPIDYFTKGFAITKKGGVIIQW